MRITALIVTCLLFLACGNVENLPKIRFPYTLKDFSPHLRGPLQKVITNGLFNDDTREDIAASDPHADLSDTANSLQSIRW